MKKLFLGAALLLVMATGCAELRDAAKGGADAVVGAVSVPPETVASGVKLALDFILNVLGVFLRGAMGTFGL